MKTKNIIIVLVFLAIAIFPFALLVDTSTLSQQEEEEIQSLVEPEMLVYVEGLSSSTENKDGRGLFKVTIQVSANVGDVYIPEEFMDNNFVKGLMRPGFTYQIIPQNLVEKAYNIKAEYFVSSSTVQPVDGNYIIAEGKTEKFTLQINVLPSEGILCWVRIRSVFFSAKEGGELTQISISLKDKSFQTDAIVIR